MEISSFQPVSGKHPKILILGTIPGKESLRKQEYYGHPRNSFWEILSSITGIGYDRNTYSTKISLIIKADLALWDVCGRAVRKTSLDSDIKDEIPNPVDIFLTGHPTIKAVFFNGKTAARLYDKYFKKDLSIQYVTLLSTSPANASYSVSRKHKNWESAFNRLLP